MTRVVGARNKEPQMNLRDPRSEPQNSVLDTGPSFPESLLTSRFTLNHFRDPCHPSTGPTFSVSDSPGRSSWATKIPVYPVSPHILVLKTQFVWTWTQDTLRPVYRSRETRNGRSRHFTLLVTWEVPDTTPSFLHHPSQGFTGDYGGGQ